MSINNLDDLFREKLGSREFEFRAEAWQKMEAMLPDPPRKPPVIYRYRVAAGLTLFLLLSGAIGWWTSSQDATTATQVAENTLVEATEEANAAGAITEESTTPVSEQATRASEAEGTVAESPTGAHPNSNASQMAATAEERSDTEAASLARAADTDNQVLAAAAVTTPANVTQQAAATTPNRGTSRSAGQTAAVQQTTQSRLADAGSTDLQLPAMNDPMRMPVRSAQIMSGETTSANAVALVAHDPIYVQEMPNLKPMKRHSLGALVGLNMARPFESGTFDNSMATNAFGGLTYSFSWKPRWNLRIDALYQVREGVETHKTYHGKEYGFGSAEDVLTVENQQLHYLELPVMAGFQVTPRSQVTAGVHVGYLLNCDNEVVHEHHGTFEQWSRVTEERGHLDGFNRWDVALNMGYEYEFIPNFLLGGRVQYGLTDITDDSFYGTNQFDNNIQFRIFAGYKFIRL